MENPRRLVNQDDAKRLWVVGLEALDNEFNGRIILLPVSSSP